MRLTAICLIASFLSAQPSGQLARATEPGSAGSVRAFERIEWRFIGPANMGGRTTDVEGVAGNPNIVYAGAGGGGLWKTTNGGVTWTPIFERQGSYSIGDIALEPNNPEVIWVGTGEANPRNSVSSGDGVYKSTDGGKTWKHLGLKDTERISRVLVHPQSPDIVYVGALGHIFGPHPERGVYMTTDGGRSWQKTLYIDDRHGVADMDIDPANPNILYAAMWEFERKPWMHHSGSEQGGVFRSVDGGRTWTKLANGLPKLMGRIGIKVSPSRPNTVYVVAESKEGTLFRSDDRGDSFRTLSRDRNIPGRGFYYSDIRVDPADENRVYALASTLQLSTDGGRTFRNIANGVHPDFHAMWIDPKNPDRIWIGQDGGLAVSFDRGENWEAVQNIPLGQFYQIHADNRQPFYHIVGGLQDNGTWSGPGRTREPAGILTDDWSMVSFGDGFHATSHPDDPDLFLTESQGGSLMLTNMRTREQQSVTPAPRGFGGPAGMQKYRFNWNAPIEPSHHVKNTVYLGGNVLFRTSDFGKTWKPVSPDLTRNEPEKQKDAGGPVYYENTFAEYHATIISIGESPVRPGTIWVGTDDGNLQRTTDGERWTNLTPNLPVPSHSPVSHVEASRAGADAAYVAFDRHMFDDFRPLIYKTTDGGRTYTPLVEGLPAGAYVHVVREDPRNPNLLYAGTEAGLFVSWDGGKKWQRLHLKNLPHVAVHDIIVHPRENDLILGTHGRSIVILDDATFVQQWSGQVASEDAHLFDMRPAVRYAARNTKMFLGSKAYKGPNPAYGALITYHLKSAVKELKIEILGSDGKVIRTLRNPPKDEGVNRASWDLRLDGPAQRRQQDESEEEQPGRRFLGQRTGPQAPPGRYTVRLTANGGSYEKPVEVKLDSTLNVSAPDLRKQFEAAMKVREMTSGINLMLRALDSLKEQVAGVEKIVKDRMPQAAKDLNATLREARDEVEKWQGMLAREQDPTRPAPPPALMNRLGGLSGLDDVNAPPTAAQTAYLAEVEAEHQRTLKEISGALDSRVPKWNEALGKAGAPALVK